MEFAQEALFRPLGIDGAEWPAGHDGVPIGAAELRLTAPEMLRIGQMMRAGGSWEGRQVVPAAFVREATTRKIATDIPPRGRPELWGYGYLFWLSSIPGDDSPAYNASGFGGQFIYVVPALEVVRGDVHRCDLPGGGDPDRDDHSRDSAVGGALKGRAFGLVQILRHAL